MGQCWTCREVKAEEEEVIEIAQELFRMHYGRPRQHKVRRKDAGMARARKEGSLATWMWRSRSSLAAAVAKAPSSTLSGMQKRAAQLVETSTWTEKHESELLYQTIKGRELRLQSVADRQHAAR